MTSTLSAIKLKKTSSYLTVVDEFVCLSGHEFPKVIRLIKPKDFQYVFANADKLANKHWMFIVRKNSLTYPRLGLAIAKKQLPKAVWRNRIKRLARETFRQHTKDIAGYDVVVLTKKGTQNVENIILIKSFLHLVRKIK